MQDISIGGMSQGDLLGGTIISGDTMYFITLNEGIWDRENGLTNNFINKLWTKKGGGTWGVMELQLIETEVWVRKMNGYGSYVWAPPPEAAAVSVDMFVELSYKCIHGTHMFVLMQVMTQFNLNNLGKDADLMLKFVVGTNVWPCSQHKALNLFAIISLLQKNSHRGPCMVI